MAQSVWDENVLILVLSLIHNVDMQTLAVKGALLKNNPHE